MPKIPDIGYRTSPTGPLNTPRATAEAFGGAQARGLQQAGQTITRSAETFDQIRDRQAQFEAGLQLVEDTQTVTKAYEQAKQEAPPGAQGFTDAVTKKFDEWLPAALDKGPKNTEAQKKLAAGYAQLKARVIDNAMQFEAQARTAETLRRTNDATDEMANTARADPTTMGNQLALSETLIKNAGLDKQTESATLLKIHDKIYRSGADGWTTQFETQPVTIAQLDAAIAQVKKGDFGFKDNLDPQTFDNVLTRLENRKNQLKEENKQTVLYAIQDEKAAIATNGRFTGMVTEKLLHDTFPNRPEYVKRVMMDLHSEQRKYNIKQSHLNTSPQEDKAYLSGLQARVRGEGAAFKRQEFIEAQQVIAAKYRDWMADPMAYMVAHDASLAATQQQASTTGDPEAGRLLTAKTDAWYDKMGTPPWAREYLGRGAAKTMAGALNALPAEQAANELYKMQAADPTKYQQKLRELDNAGLDPGFMVLGRMDSTREAVGRKVLAEALQIGRQDLIKNIGTTAKADIDNAVLTKMAGFNATLAMAGTQGGKIQAAEMGAMQDLAYKIKSDTPSLSASDVADKAYNILHGTRDYGDGYSVPKYAGVNMLGMVEDSQREKMRQLTPEMFAPAAVPPGATPQERAVWESPAGVKQRQDAQYQAARRQGVWANSPTGDGVILMAPDDTSKVGYSPVRTKDGNFVEIKFNDVLQHPAPSATGLPTQLTPDLGGMGYAEQAIREEQRLRNSGK